MVPTLPDLRTCCRHGKHVDASQQACQLHWESLLPCRESATHFSPHKTHVTDPYASPAQWYPLSLTSERAAAMVNTWMHRSRHVNFTGSRYCHAGRVLRIFRHTKRTSLTRMPLQHNGTHSP